MIKHLKGRIFIMKLLFVLFTLISTAQAVTFVEPKPLDQVVTTPVGTCSPSKTVKVPFITWSGDIIAIQSNLGAQTAPGSLIAERGLNINLVRQDVFTKQLADYMSCASPYLRGTSGMIQMASELTNKNKSTELVVIYSHSWSSGGDVLVVDSTKIKSAKDLKGKTIVLQNYGPHVQYIAKILSDANINPKEVNLKYVADLTGTAQSPMAAMQEGKADAVMVVSPDAAALTNGGGTGTGAESSVKNAKILLSTKSASKVILDVYAVRRDYYESNKKEVFAFVDALHKAEEQVSKILGKNGDKAQATKLLKMSAKMLLDSEQAVADTQGLYSDATLLGFDGNKKVFEDASYPRSFTNVTNEAQASFIAMGLLKNKTTIAKANWSLNDFKKGLLSVDKVEAPTFDSTKVATVINKKQMKGELDSSSLFDFQINFKPNQNDFQVADYQDSFEKAVKLASVYGGSVLTISGHSDVLGYLKKKKEGAPTLVLTQIKQAAKNLSMARANAVRDSMMKYAKSKGIRIDESQIVVVGNGIDKPVTGMCGGDPCVPSSEKVWLDQMRVVFQIIQIEAETEAFSPL